MSISDKIKKKLQEKRSKRRKSKYTPVPIYDDVYYNGMKWLDSLAGSPCPDTITIRKKTVVKRPKSKRKRCIHCNRNRLAKFIEWHPGIEAWQCSDFDSCDKAQIPKKQP